MVFYWLRIDYTDLLSLSEFTEGSMHKKYSSIMNGKEIQLTFQCLVRVMTKKTPMKITVISTLKER